jgi:hypothetical protein
MRGLYGLVDDADVEYSSSSNASNSARDIAEPGAPTNSAVSTDITGEVPTRFGEAIIGSESGETRNMARPSTSKNSVPSGYSVLTGDSLPPGRASLKSNHPLRGGEGEWDICPDFVANALLTEDNPPAC